MDQSPFCETRDTLHAPTGRSPYPLPESAGVARVAQRAGRDHADQVCSVALCGAVEPAQYFYGAGHHLGIKSASAEDGFTQSRDFAVFFDDVQTVAREACDFQPNRVSTDINRGKGRHQESYNRDGLRILN